MNARRVNGLRRFPHRAFCASILLATCCEAQSLAPDGCPVFHCTVEATGVTFEPVIEAVSTTNSNISLGELPKHRSQHLG